MFEKLTGTKHQTLADNWAKRGRMTTCNGLVGNFGK